MYEKRRRSGKEYPKFPKWESLKNKSEKVACFPSPNPNHQLPSFSPAIHHNFTTKKPHPTTHFHQNPQQKQGPTTQKNYSKAFLLSDTILAPRKDDDRGEHFTPVQGR
jgi:hypothetical protein